ncbi:MAG: hypothetical protein ACJAUV_000236 [Flavobacteriales bacterium]
MQVGNDNLRENKAKTFIVWVSNFCRVSMYSETHYFAIVLANHQRGRKDFLVLVPTVIGILLHFVPRAEFIEVPRQNEGR